MSKKQICLYAQTHWDREWYWEFEKYRTQLISVARLLVEELESSNLPVFHLDGQTCALEDILDVEPSLEERLRPLIEKKQLRVGPWYVLADQMLVSGESLIRNLERGLKIATKYGDPMMVGYCPDTFGHTQDMPRILKGFGIDKAIVWRGVPELEDGPEFYWKSPDGSKVLGYLLPDGYYQTAFQETQYDSIEDKKDMLAPYLLSWLGMTADGQEMNPNQPAGRHKSYSKATKSSLVPVGGDHLYPPIGLNKMVNETKEKLNSMELQSEVDIDIVDLETFLNTTLNTLDKPLELVRLIEGELRTNTASEAHCRAFMLAGVLSSRLYLKRENRLLEHRLHQVCEPLLSTLWSIGLIRYPESELDHASKLLLLNHPHDSICGCSVDHVHREMMTRGQSINQIVDLLDRQVQEEMLCPGVHEWSRGKKSSEKPFGLGRWQMDLNDPDANCDGFVAFNYSGVNLQTPVEFKYAVDASKLDQKSKGHKTVLEQSDQLMTAVHRELNAVIGENLTRQISEVSTQTEVFGGVGGVPVFKDICVIEGYVQLGELPKLGTVLHLAKSKQSVKELASVASSMGGSSIDSSRLEKGESSKTVHESESTVSVNESGTLISNNYFDVSFADTGDLSIKTKFESIEKVFSLNPKFYDVADAGDSYNFDPVFDDKPIVANFRSMKVLEKGPLVATIELVHDIEIPESVIETSQSKYLSELDDVDDIITFARSKNLISHELSTRVTVKANCPILHFETEWENKAKDHRLEVRLDTGSTVKKSWSENHFSLVERSVSKSKVELPVQRAIESPLDRFPCQRFFVANDQVFLNKGLPEYSVCEDSVSMTILRSFSMLSRKRLLTRGGGAGPHMPTPEGNCLGVNKVSYGWAPLALLTGKSNKSNSLSTSSQVAAYELAERFMNAVWASPVSNQFAESVLAIFESKKASFNLLDISNSKIRLVAMYKSNGKNEIILRLLNVSSESAQSELVINLPAKSVWISNLAGNELESLEFNNRKVNLQFTVNELKTLKLKF